MAVAVIGSEIRMAIQQRTALVCVAVLIVEIGPLVGATINAITNSIARDVLITHARGSISKEEARDSANTGVNGV